MAGIFDELKKEHSIIIDSVKSFEKSLARIGLNLDAADKFIEAFESRISNVIGLEEKAIFPRLEKYLGKDVLFVMTYTHEAIKSEFEGLKKALLNQSIADIHKTGGRLIKAVRYHIEKEDSIVLNEAEKNFTKNQVNYLSSAFSRLIMIKGTLTA